MKTSYLFIYGSLKRHERLHQLYMQGTKFVTDAATKPLYKLYDSGHGFPFLVKSNQGKIIAGEIYVVDAGILSRLDLLEGVAQSWYERVPIQIASQPALVVEGYLYKGDATGLKEIETGIWVGRKER